MSGAVEGVALLPCRFCGGKGDIESQPSYSQVATTYERHRGWCDQCCFGLDWHSYKPDAVAAWNTRTTPPARSYADEDVARIIDPYAWQGRESDLASADKWHKKADAYAVDTDPNIFPLGQQALDNIVSQWHGLAERFAKSAVDKVKPSLAKAAAIRLLSQGGKA